MANEPKKIAKYVKGKKLTSHPYDAYPVHQIAHDYRACTQEYKALKKAWLIKWKIATWY